MRLNNRKIDMLLKLVMCFLPFVMALIVALGTQATEWDLASIYAIFEAFLQNISQSPFGDFMIWLQENITFNVPALNFVAVYMFYIILVEMLILFKNFMIWIIRFANDLFERGLNND